MFRSVLAIAISSPVVVAKPLDFSMHVHSIEDDIISRLMRNANPTGNSRLGRVLEDETDAELDLSGYSLQFEQCGFIESNKIKLIEEEDPEKFVASAQRSVPNRSNHVAIFRFCPSMSSDYCDSNLEYILDLEEYLETTVRYQQGLQEEVCKVCDSDCEDFVFGLGDDMEEIQDWEGDDMLAKEGKKRRLDVDCNVCYDECSRIENMEYNGYIDATEFIHCTMIYDPEDDDKGSLYAGPICSGNGSKIKIGVFNDEFCSVPDWSKDVENYLVDGDGYFMKLSHALLKTSYSDDRVSCDGQESAMAMCDRLYNAAEKYQPAAEEDVDSGTDFSSSAYDTPPKKCTLGLTSLTTLLVAAFIFTQ